MTGAAMSASKFSLYFYRGRTIPGTLRFGDLALLSSLCFCCVSGFLQCVGKQTLCSSRFSYVTL